MSSEKLNTANGRSDMGVSTVTEVNILFCADEVGSSIREPQVGDPSCMLRNPFVT